jgi:uncharacterized damage-inducible protein DinB
MKTHLIRLFEYNQWANSLFSETLLKADYKNQKINVLLSHTFAAELIWLHRVENIDGIIPGVWELFPAEEAVISLKKADEHWIQFINKVTDFETVIDYKDSEGNSHQTVLKDIISHVANHGTHHRGQIATLLRLENIAPPASDFIFFARS